ncbi:TnpV protein [Clostridiales bacterium NSJ-32]|uniref:TnpV protein n=1 Tax=Bianquea renquensis TaxID=2763661 RepID=A0A926DXV6_9FIRM|nr:TnpV protein [Bianquea renquensis]
MYIQPIGLFGQRHLRYLKECHNGVCINLLTSGRLNTCLADIDEQAQECFERLIEQMRQVQGTTEQLKAENQLEWVLKIQKLKFSAPIPYRLNGTYILHCCFFRPL